ncbi:hypothetical protein [Defluviimonas salinarum]|uniref:Thioredoxin-like fold domain-containing protein n=1 Tax=Defluviimonas salinarum TaxID=2992147 RepID=A0ABT3J4D3_9RHOB|nr:hypothetical protein [Defluviimonas salinarum]MCW3782549.1 hypothetical protein [Defluviimonas salinarum]
MTFLVRAVSPLRRAGPALAAVILAVAGGQAFAQEAPGFLKDLPSRYRGEILGLQAWSIDDSDVVWFVSPDGQGLIGGYAYDLGGQDVGSAALGVTPVDAWSSFGLARPGAGPVISPVGENLSPFPGVDDGEAVSAVPDTVTPPESVKLVEDAMAVAREALADLPDEKQKAVLTDLVERMDRARTPEEFQLLLLEWSGQVRGETAMTEAARAALAQVPGLPETTLSVEPAAVTPPPTVLMPVDDGAPATVDPAATANAEGNGAALIETIRKDAFWFAVGASDAPVVYAFIDPQCPYCAKSIRNLRPDVEGGRLQLRVILAPLISKTSPASIAGILLSDDPVGAFWEHEILYAERGASDLVKRDFSELPATMNQGLKKNYDIVVDNKLPGVPFFAWSTAEGPKFLSGVPEAGRFSEALRDSYDGIVQ